jgi:hypothetical protein
MLAVGAFTYGMAMSMILSVCARNRQQDRADPPLLRGLGYLLCGASAGIAISLGLVAISN